MANGNVSFCVTCTHFKAVPLNDSNQYVGSKDTDCQCMLHRVHLPFSETDQLLICSDWVDHRGINSVIRWSKKYEKLIEPGYLYSYPDEYSSIFSVFSELSKLKKMESTLD